MNIKCINYTQSIQTIKPENPSNEEAVVYCKTLNWLF